MELFDRDGKKINHNHEKKEFNAVGERSEAGQRTPSRAEHGSAKGEFKKKSFKPRPAPKSAVDGFKGRDVVIKMRDGTFVIGRLESIYQYEFVILGNNGMPEIVMKHAVDRISLKGV